jgi:5'-nucleotidase
LGLTLKAADLAAYRLINAELWQAYQRGEITPPALQRERFRRFLAHLGHGPRRAAFLATAYIEELGSRGELYAGVRNALRSLHRRHALAAVTNGIDRIQRARLRAARLETFFDAVVTSEATGFAKPDPRIVTVALGKLGTPPKEALFVGDDPGSDGRAARDAGVAFCWMDHGRPLAPGVRRPPRRVQSLSGLLTLLGG